MKKNIARKSVAIISKFLGTAALLFVSTASVYCFHRPNTPAELRVKN